MTSFELIKDLCKKNGTSISKLEVVLGYGNGSLAKAKKIPGYRIHDIAKYFNVPMESLMSADDTPEIPELTNKDKRDIAKDLDRIMGEIKSGNDEPLYYNGIEIDDASIGLLQNAIEYALRETKKENKVKYNPNKNKK